MAWNLADSGSDLFADGNTGHVYTYPGGAPDSGDLLILGVNSDTTVSTPSGWTLVGSAVGNQGGYLFRRVAGASEASSVTVTTAGNFNAALTYLRYTGADTGVPEQTDQAAVNGVAGTTTPAVAPAALAGSGYLAVLVGELHNGTTAASAAAGSAGYTVVVDSGILGSGSSAVQQVVAARTDASGSETPTITWSNTFSDRYAFFAAFAPASGGTTVFGTASASGSGPAGTALGLVTVLGTAAASGSGPAGATTGVRTVFGTATATGAGPVGIAVQGSASVGWATVSDVLANTGVTVTSTALAYAAVDVSVFANRAPSASAGMGARDLYWMNLATCYQAAWRDEQITVAGRQDVESFSQDGMSVTYGRRSWGAVLAPMAARSLKNLSWKATRTSRTPNVRLALGLGEAEALGLGAEYAFLNESFDQNGTWYPL